MQNIKTLLRRLLYRRGWFVRTNAGLSAGLSLPHDLCSVARLPPPRVVLDIGAHHGETAEQFSHAFPAAQIHSFEPIQANFAVLVARARAWPHVTCYRLALGERTEEVSVFLRADSQTHTLQPRPGDTLRPNQERELVQVITLDAFAATHSLATIDLLKLDTEGHELAVLRGARDLLAHRRIGAIFLEASLDPADSTHTALPTAAAFLRPYGYELTAIYDQVMWRNPVKLAYFNALFVPALA